METNITIQEAVKEYHITSRALRYYEEIGLINAQRNEMNNRMYNDENQLRIQCIMLYKAMGLSLEEIRQMIENNDGISALEQLCKDKKKWLKHEINTKENQITHLMNTRDKLQDEEIKSILDIHVIAELNQEDKTHRSFHWIFFWKEITLTRVLIIVFIFMDFTMIIALLSLLIESFL